MPCNATMIKLMCIPDCFIMNSSCVAHIYCTVSKSEIKRRVLLIFIVSIDMFVRDNCQKNLT